MATLTEREAGDVDWLLDHGLGASARTRIGDRRGALANQRRGAARHARPLPGIHALVTDPSGESAWALPVKIERARARAVDARAAEALELAEQLVCTKLAFARVGIRVAAESRFPLHGWSLGLPAALAFVAVATGRAPRRPVFATGRLLGSGRVEHVDHVPTKVAAALSDLAGSDGLLIAPRGQTAGLEGGNIVGVETLDEAIELVFGKEPLVPAPGFADLKWWLSSLTAWPSDRALETLDAVRLDSLAVRDRALVLMHRGNHLRHVGRTEEARSAHDRAHEIARAMDRADREHVELELRNTLLDLFSDLETHVAWLEQNVERGDFASHKNELFYRGTLSRAYAMQARFPEALATRRALMHLHDGDQELERQRPQSLCELAWLAAWNDDVVLLEHTLEQLHGLHPTEAQRTWNTYAAVRALTVLGQHERVIGWYQGKTVIPATRPSHELLDDAAGRARHPVASILRAVARSLRRSGRAEDAHRLAASVIPQPDGLEGWVGWLCHVEDALALADLGSPEAETELRRARDNLVRCSPHASQHYRGVFEGDREAIERELDRIVY
jgi:hypothetical protein